MVAVRSRKNPPINHHPPQFSPAIPGCEGQIGYAHCDRCGAPIRVETIRIVDNSIYLCPICYQAYCAIPEGCLKTSVRRFLMGNVV